LSLCTLSFNLSLLFLHSTKFFLFTMSLALRKERNPYCDRLIAIEWSAGVA